MSLVVNKNIGAMNAHYYLKLNETNFSKSVEKLSSGMKINRAADDPAGLVLSETYRAQVDGLAQAIDNAQNGISLVQTAEAALDEVNTVLRSMRTLALHAASTGTSDTNAVTADQAQIDKSIEQLDRIAGDTAFGTRKLFNGDAGVNASATSNEVTFVAGGSKVEAGVYNVEITQVAAKGQVTSTAARTLDTATSGNAGLTLGTVIAAVGDATFTVDGDAVDVTGVATVGALIDEINNTAALQTKGIQARLDDTGAIRIESQIGEMGAHFAVTASDGTGGTIETVTAFNAVNSTTGNADGNARMGTDETLTFRDGAGKFVQVALTENTTMDAAVTQINSALDNAEIEITADFDAVSHTMRFTNDAYGGATTIKNQIESNAAGAATNLGLVAVADTSYSIADLGGGALTGTAGADVDGTIGGYTATGSGQFLTGDTGGVEGLKLKITSATTGSKGSVTVTQSSLTFQIGAFSNQTVNMSLGKLTTDLLGTGATGTTTMGNDVNIGNIDVTTADGAQDAIKVIDDAIDQISAIRSELGSFQKDVLESTVRNLGVAAQNMAASESIIRDADMAEEMLSFSRAQILQSTSMAMLAQANQAPQSIMRLFG